MKPVAMLLTVISLVTGTLFIGGSFTTKKKAGTAEHGSDLILPGVSLKKEKAGPSPKKNYKEATSPKAIKLKLTKPETGKVEEEEIITACSFGPIEAEYPGGAAAWQRYLKKNMRYPDEAIDNEIQGSVVVQFVVDEEGNVCDVEAVSGSQALSAEAVLVIKKSGKWTPAIQNGRCVKSIKRQPFIICLEAE